MYVDTYTKVVLTIIALALTGILLRDTVNTPAQAYGNGQDVRITNYETDISAGETLYVYCTNCE